MFELSEEALGILGKKMVDYLKARIAAKNYPYGPPGSTKKSNKIATGSLYDSINSSVEIDSSGAPVLLLQYNDYFKYVNRGRRIKVKRVPLDVLKEWINVRGIRPRNKKGRFLPNNEKNIINALNKYDLILIPVLKVEYFLNPK